MSEVPLYLPAPEDRLHVEATSDPWTLIHKPSVLKNYQESLFNV